MGEAKLLSLFFSSSRLHRSYAFRTSLPSPPRRLLWHGTPKTRGRTPERPQEPTNLRLLLGFRSTTRLGFEHGVLPRPVPRMAA